ncbi:sensor histidine kinase [Kurthia senegalensis]|uniref:sensor histidine kinase n=1 Tax=Kurthia senegalensis TaxID=1033740 RepID=UPI000289758C|nr:HAMP domain-containing sensor histidine kinase [Kurthia senegalensis]
MNKIGFKWGTLIMALFLAILAPLGILIDRIFSNIFTDYVDSSVDKMATRAVLELERKPEITSEQIDTMISLSDDSVIVFDREGRILSRSAYEFYKDDTIDSQWSGPLESGEKSYAGDRTENATGAKFHYVAKPLLQDGKYAGGVLVMANVTSWYDTMYQIRYWLIRSIGAAILLALVYTILISWRLSRPLVEMEKATRKIAKGEDTQVAVQSKDEVGSLGVAINDLSIELNNYRKNRSELLANISHELRTPVSYLQGYAQLIEKGQYRSEEDLKRYARIIDQESVRLSSLIQDVFDLSKMEEGRMPFYTQSIDMEQLLEQAVDKVRLKATAKSLTLDLHIAGPLHDLETDGMRMEQIMLNLMQNAVNYTEAGSINVQAFERKEQLVIEVSDTGVGIPKEDVPFIFDRFHRVEKSRVRDKGGTGLGLAIVKGLTEGLGGDITVESEEGQGTTFRLSFPLHTLSTNER